MENQQLVSLSRQCSSTPAGCGRFFLAKNNVTTLEHSPYSPNLAPSDCYYIEISTEGRGFCDATDIINNSTQELKFSQTPVQSLPNMYICKRGQFRRKCSLNDCTVPYFSEI